MAQSSFTLTLNENRQPYWVRWLNWGGQKLQNAGIPLVKLTEASLLADAEEKSQLSDWGDESFLVGLQILLASLNEEADLSLIGRFLIREDLTRLLVNRLQIQATLKQHPEILDVPIQRPLIITGLPRSGTTFLHRLLAQDPQFRWLRFWELIQPCPPPDSRHAGRDPRIQLTQTIAQQYQTLVPVISKTHVIDAQLPEEENQLFEHSFASPLFELRANVPSYASWFRSQAMWSQYIYYRQQLQLLSWHWRGRWLLKAPAHLTYLNTLRQVFPDACIVQTHRDPCAVVPSICSLAAIVRSIYSENIDLPALGQYWLDRTSYAHQHSQQSRTQMPASSIFDVNYADLVQDPIRTVQQIYQFWGDTLSIQTQHRMQDWLKANPQRKYGTHQYSLEQFSLTAAEVQQRFA